MQLRGLDFAAFVRDSLLSKTMIENGFSVSIAAEEEEKDFGDGIIGHYSCGHVYFRKGEDTCLLYQSRFSDSWAIDKNGYRPPLVRFLAEVDKLNNKEFVDNLVLELAI